MLLVKTSSIMNGENLGDFLVIRSWRLLNRLKHAYHEIQFFSWDFANWQGKAFLNLVTFMVSLLRCGSQKCTMRISIAYNSQITVRLINSKIRCFKSVGIQSSSTSDPMYLWAVLIGSLVYRSGLSPYMCTAIHEKMLRITTTLYWKSISVHQKFEFGSTQATR